MLATPSQNFNRYYSGTGKAIGTSNFAGTFTGSIRTKAQNFVGKGAWVYPGTAQMFWVPRGHLCLFLVNDSRHLVYATIV